ncbi:MAG: GDP-L-fucose synthase family protein [Candidatus Aenigmatarchaeota archaeon]
MSNRVLVTGAKGFLGSHLVEVLKTNGYEVITADRPGYDLREKEDVSRALNNNPDYVVHLAANVGGIGYNEERPGELFYDNCKMGIEMMEQCRKHSVDKLVNIGSVCAYPERCEIPFKEEDLWEGYPEETNAPYGIAKRILATQGKAYKEQYGLNSVLVLPANMYGPRDNFDLESSHVIPAIIRKCVEARRTRKTKVEAWGTGEPTREFLFVKDSARGIVKAMEDRESAAPVNLGTNREISISKLVELIAELSEFEGSIHWDTSKPDGQPRRKLDIGVATDELGFSPEVDLRDGLARTIKWYENNH